MPKSLNLLLTLLLPLCGCCVLVTGSLYRPPLLSNAPDASELDQRKPAFANRDRLAILHQQYRFYQYCRHLPGQKEQAAAEYNQCVADSDPSALRGTTLPHHLP